jgi:hypothetical protein
MEKEQVITETVDNDVEKSFDVLIEEQRAPLYKKFNVSKKISSILTFVILAIAIAGMYLITGKETWMPILGWSLLAAGVAGMLAFYFLNKRTFDTQTRAYIEFVNVTLNKETFADSKFADITPTDTKLELTAVAGNGVYNDLVRAASRNIINGKYDDLSFKYAEAALFKNQLTTKGKRGGAVAAFVGKYFEVDNSIKFGGNIVINISREEPVDAPNALDNKAKLYTDNGLTVYGDEGCEFRSIIGEKFLGSIKKIKAENHLLNLAISIWEAHTFVFMSYGDDVIALPFEKAMNPEAFKSFVSDLKKVFETLTLLGK